MPGPQLSHQLHLMGKLQARYASPLPLSLIHILVRARGQALYRDILYERVWGPDAEPNPRALDLHIHRLRKKLDWADKIVTVPKVGYKLLAER